MEKRPPVVSILGHIDHGKSTLLDYIRKTNIVEKEAGGITQHISAYEVVRPDGNKITFLDTPGHEAFANVRTRGASVADIAVLIVSGEDGPKPQTLEVYKYIENAKLPFIVAITKVDKPTADVERTKQLLAESGIYVEGYGGSVPFVPISAKTGQGVDELIELITLQADLLDLSGNKETLAEGVIIESRLDPKRGLTAVAIIKNGTISKGLFAACGTSWAPLRMLLDAQGRQVESLSFSSPVQIIGWSELPAIGSGFKTFLKKVEAIKFADESRNNLEAVGAREIWSQPDFHRVKDSTIASAEAISTLPLILKADTAGSLEAIESELMKLSRERIIAKIILAAVGTIGENDVKLALTTPGALILGFHTKVDSAAANLAERSGVPINLFTIIYELTDRVKALLAEREPRVEVEETSGAAKVLKLFSSTKNKQVLGARVLSGIISKNNTVKIMRRDSEIGRGKVRELQQAKVATEKVEEGAEFGAMVESKTEIAHGDILEAVSMTTK